MKKILFLDLEQTIISSWNDPHIINAKAIRDHIEHSNYDEFSIFSFAVYHNEDRHTCINHPDFVPKIARCLDIQINVEYIPTIEELRILLCRQFNLPPGRVDRDDFFCFSNKDTAFFNYCRQSFKDCECTLIDDAIWDETVVSIASKNLVMRTINVLSL